jgi:L-cysteine desulfidase
LEAEGKMKNINIADQPKILKDLCDALTQASGAASQLTHTMQDPRWMMIRESIDLTKEGVINVITFQASKSVIMRAV